jgi:hypothetical protein
MRRSSPPLFFADLTLRRPRRLGEARQRTQRRGPERGAGRRGTGPSSSSGARPALRARSPSIPTWYKRRGRRGAVPPPHRTWAANVHTHRSHPFCVRFAHTLAHRAWPGGARAARAMAARPGGGRGARQRAPGSRASSGDNALWPTGEGGEQVCRAARQDQWRMRQEGRCSCRILPIRGSYLSLAGCSRASPWCRQTRVKAQGGSAFLRTRS